MKSIETRLAEAEQRVRALTEVLEWLDRRGGLGYDAHDRIKSALLASEPATSVSASEAPASEPAKAPDS